MENDPVEAALGNARQERREGRTREAEQAYLEAAHLARSIGNETALAHALRHMSDLARARGDLAKAWQDASEAVALYRRGGDPIGLANAIRLQALSAADREEARACWSEARDLYSRLGVEAGVRECEIHLKE